MSHKVTVTMVRVRGRKNWQVRFHELGRLRRRFFDSKPKAEAEAARRRGDALAADQQFFLLDAAARDKLMMARRIAAERSVDLLALVMAAADGSSPAAADVLAEMLLAKKTAMRDGDYLKSLRQVVNMFLRGRERRAVNLFSLADVEAFLNEKNPASRSTLRARLATFFKFAVGRKYRADNPCAVLEHVKVLKAPPQIFSPEQVEVCLKWFVTVDLEATNDPGGGFHADGLPWFLLTTFCGVRPEEAMQVEAKKHLRLTADKPHIEITSDICKTGQWRIVYPLPEVVTALKAALKMAARQRKASPFPCAPALPFRAKRKEKLQQRLRAVLGLAAWPKDITRHSASSYWLALTNDQRHVAEMLGHSERTARSIYKKPVERAVAEKFYATLRLCHK